MSTLSIREAMQYRDIVLGSRVRYVGDQHPYQGEILIVVIKNQKHIACKRPDGSYTVSLTPEMLEPLRSC